MKKYFIFMVLFAFAAATQGIAQEAQCKELNMTIKEMIEPRFSDESTKVSFDLLDYDVKEGKIANIGASIEVDHDLFNVTFNVNARHPKLGLLKGPFQNLTQDVVLIGEMRFNYEEMFKKNSEKFKAGAEELKDLRKQVLPGMLEMFRGMILETIEEVKKEHKEILDITGITITEGNVARDPNGMLQAFSIVIKCPKQFGKLSPGEYEIYFAYEEPDVVVRFTKKDPTLSQNIFDDSEYLIIHFMDRLREKDPAAVAMVNGFLEILKSNIESRKKGLAQLQS